MATYLELTAELTGILPGLSPLLAEKYINRAWKEICDAKTWGFLRADVSIRCPGVVIAGAVSITENLTTITFDATASAALLALGTVPGLEALQVRFGAAGTTGGIYNMRVVDSVTDPTAIVVTLDRIVVEATNATSTYQVFRAYVAAPADFRRWESITEPDNAIRMDRARLRHTSSDFDIWDPQRQSQGLAYFLGHYLGNRILNTTTQTVTPNATSARGAPIYEFWPTPTNGQNFFARYQRRGLAFTANAGELPDQISDGLVLARALGYHAYTFAQANQAHFPTFKGVNWGQLTLAARAEYRELLHTESQNDEDQSHGKVWNKGHTLRGRHTGGLILDANYLQSHLVNI